MIELLNKWKQDLETTGYAERTVDLRLYYAKEFIKISGLSKPQDLTPQHIRLYQDYVSDSGFKQWTKWVKLVSMRDFLVYLKKNDLTLLDPRAYIEFPKKGETLPRDIFTEEEIGEVFRYLKDNGTLWQKAVMEVLYATGIRHNELKNLNLYDLDLKQRTLLVRSGKGKKDRLLPLTKSACTVLKEYTSSLRPERKSDEYALFVNRFGQRMTSENLKKHFTPHAIRHSIATHLLRRGLDLRYIQAFLGHERLSTTQIYTRVVKQDLKNEIDKKHPRNKMRG